MLDVVHPNPPRLITVAIAVVLAVVGVTLALPIPQALELVRPILEPITFGVVLDAQLGWLLLLASSVLLIVGSLLPGI